MNEQTNTPTPDAVQAMHRSVLTLDTHVDIPWPDRGDFATGADSRCVDLPKLREGGMGAACLVAYVGQGAVGDAGHAAASAKALAMLDVIAGTDDVPGVRVCDSADALMAAHRAGDIAIIPAVENGYTIGQDIGLLARFRERGVRYMTLTHNGHNDLADAAIPLPALGNEKTLHGGLSAIGREAIAQMNAHGIVVDVSHAAKSTMMQAAEQSSMPVVASHSCARALCDHPRNLDDEQLRLLRDKGGVIQITAMSSFLKPAREGKASVRDMARHVRHVANLIGVEHVGVSSDFDGGGMIEGWRDASQSRAVTEALLQEGFSDRDLALIWGENFLRVLAQAEQR